MTSVVIPVNPFDLVIFGATGDLSQRKLLPALYHRYQDGQMPDQARIIGLARTQQNTTAFRQQAKESLNAFIPNAQQEQESIEQFLTCLHYLHNDVMNIDGWQTLHELLNQHPDRIRVYYLAVAPTLFGVISNNLAKAQLINSCSRLVVEKPLGHSYDSAKQLNQELSKAWDEHQIYRIDHYLGKETVQNLMALRFSNALFEPLWNSHFIDHIQITAAETVGVEGRGPYYDHAGAMRDMVQNHLLQLLCLIAMEPPYQFEADAIRDEKLKILRSLRPLTERNQILSQTLRGQYDEAPSDCGKSAPSYKEESENPASTTETYVALKAEIDNWRWKGVPFYLRTGKKLKARFAEIAIVFKEPTHSVFHNLDTPVLTNMLIIRLQPNEGLSFSIMTKDPGPGGFRLRDTPLDMTFAEKQNETWRMPDAYERLLMDVVRGDQTLFMRGDEVEAAWQWIDPIIAAWQSSGVKPELYDQYSEGPVNSFGMMARDGRQWRRIES